VSAPPPLPYARARDGIRLAVRLVPKAASDRVVGIAAETDGSVALKIAVRAPPVDGKANDALLSVLAALLHVPRRDLTLAQGAAQRRKLVHVAGDPARLERLVAESLEPWLKHA